MLIKAVKEGIKISMRANHMNFWQALKKEIYMMTRIMGIKLYVKYMNGTAVEGKDFTIIE